MTQLSCATVSSLSIGTDWKAVNLDESKLPGVEEEGAFLSVARRMALASTGLSATPALRALFLRALEVVALVRGARATVVPSAGMGHSLRC
jgi:hypothetical protein